MNQINDILRRALWVAAQEHSLNPLQLEMRSIPKCRTQRVSLYQSDVPCPRCTRSCRVLLRVRRHALAQAARLTLALRPTQSQQAAAGASPG